MKKKAIFYLFIICSFYVNSQEQNSIFIQYDESMVIREIDSKITISFSINSDDKKVNTYNFKIDNLNNQFKNVPFLELRDSISIKNKTRIKTLQDFSKLNSCELHTMFSDVRKIRLIKKEKEIYLEYRLIYWSTQRGWEFVNTN